MIRVTVVGRMAADPDVGDKVTRFRVASDEWNPSTQSREAIFCPIKAFGRSKETADQYLGKGDRVAIDGRLDIRDNGKTGDERRIYTDVIADRIELLETKQTSSRAGRQAEAEPPGW